MGCGLNPVEHLPAMLEVLVQSEHSKSKTNKQRKKHGKHELDKSQTFLRVSDRSQQYSRAVYGNIKQQSSISWLRQLQGDSTVRTSSASIAGAGRIPHFENCSNQRQGLWGSGGDLIGHEAHGLNIIRCKRASRSHPKSDLNGDRN